MAPKPADSFTACEYCFTAASARAEFTLVNTPYSASHYKTPVLAPLEREGDIEVVASSRKKRFAFPPGTAIQFPHFDG
jgi:hypothetical protein